MATSLTGDGVEFPSGNTQTHIDGIVKVGFTSSTTVNHNTGSGFGARWGYVGGTEINMGVPEKDDNWYRIRWHTIADDQGNARMGTGAAIYRYTPSTGWNRVMDQGHHATLENNMNDHYWNCRVDYLIPVHSGYPNEEHRFRIYHANWSGPTRINCDIGSDRRRNGWNNNLLEVWEMDVALVNSGNLGRY